MSETSAVQTVQPVWDLLDSIVQKDDFSSENVSNGPRPEPSAALVGAEAPRDMARTPRGQECKGTGVGGGGPRAGQGRKGK